MNQLLSLLVLYISTCKTTCHARSYLPARCSLPARRSSSPSRYSSKPIKTHRSSNSTVGTYRRMSATEDDFSGGVWCFLAIVMVFVVIFNRFAGKTERKEINRKKRDSKKTVGKTHYEVLHVKPNALPEEITMQYRKLAWRYHPDKNRGNERLAEIRFKEVSAAYDTLKDRQAKEEYDQSLASASGNKPQEKSYRQELLSDLKLLAFLLAYILYYLYSLYRGWSG